MAKFQSQGAFEPSCLYKSELKKNNQTKQNKKKKKSPLGQ